MTISQYNSTKIKILNLVLIFMVILLHSYYNEAEAYPVAQSIQLIMGGNGKTGMANVLFFTLSGFLFFNGVSEAKGCFSKMKKRVRSLLIPYIIWNCVFVLWYVVIGVIPGVGSFVNSDMVSKVFSSSILKSTTELLWMPANFPLWFIRDLMIMVICSPLLYYMIKHMRWFSMFPFIAISTFVNIHISSFFELGGCVAILSSLDAISLHLTRPIVTVSMLVYFGNAIAQTFVKHSHPIMTLISCLCGIICVWKLYDVITKYAVIHVKLGAFLSFFFPILGYSFFIYLFHMPVFNIIKKISLLLFGVHEWSLILLYFTNPILMCAFAIGVAKIIQMLIPKVYDYLVGGR